MKFIIVMNAIIFALLGGFSFAESAVEYVDMFAGEVKVLGEVQVERVAVGDGKIIRADMLATGELLLIGQATGSSSLRLWNKDGTQSAYNIYVAEKDPVTRIRMDNMVRMNVKMVEFRKSALGKIGIDWSKDITGPTFGVAGDLVTNNLFRPVNLDGGITSTLPLNVKPFSTYFGIATSITSRINFLASSGDAVTLAEPTLSCANGGSAKFLAGGEVPYPVIGNNGQSSVEFKEYGIKLDISPLVDDTGNISTSILTEISQIDPSVTVNDTPGLITRRTQTQFNVKTGRTIVIAGLLNAESSKDADKIPGLGNLPYIGSLFRSENFRNSLSELMIFVTPEIVRPEEEKSMSDRHRVLLERGDEVRNRIADKVKYDLME